MAKPSLKRRERFSFGKVPEVLEVPNLLDIQIKSFEWFKTEGVREVLEEISPIEDFTGNLALEFHGHRFEEPRFSVEECKEKDMTYSARLLVKTAFINRETGEIKEKEVVLYDRFPLMTEKGTFIINGTERVVVSQLIRSPGVYFGVEAEKTSGKPLYNAKIIPNRGAWLEFETDNKDVIYVRIDRKRKLPATLLLRALDWSKNEDIIKLLGNSTPVKRTLEKDSIHRKEDALLEIYKRLRPGELPTAESAQAYLENLYFNKQRYDLAKVGRYKVNRKLGLDFPLNVTTLTKEDIVATLKYLIGLWHEEPKYTIDDIDHLGNRRIRTVGELVQNQFRIGIARVERSVKEKMATSDPQEIDPQTLINVRPIEASIKSFFATGQLSQFMDQTNPLAGLTHRRRLSALGPGGLSRERAGFEVRDVHPSHYGRMCPVETPEGPNIGLINSLATYARVNDFGFLETPYRRVVDGKVTDEIVYLTADDEIETVIAQANARFDPNTGKLLDEQVLARNKGKVELVNASDVEYMDVSPKQIVSVAASLIPFLEHNDANRVLMGANMQRQAVPLVKTQAPFVGTGMERKAVIDTGEVVLAKRSGVVKKVAADLVEVEVEKGEIDRYELKKYQRSNQGTCINQVPVVNEGDKIEAGEVIADGPCSDHGELALGANLLVAFMPWEGYNYEDAIIISERLVKDDVLTSIHIEEYEVEARDTKLGAEEITREIPGLAEEVLRNLDEEGIVRVGAEVKPGDILVGKVTPKGEGEITPEEKLLRAIFGEKARDVRDTSLRVPHGEGGKVIRVKVFSRDKGDELPPGVNKLVRVYVAHLRKVSVGDKLAGRHGNKGVISKIVPVEDMPFLEDGTPVDIILNPLGVPSRMNVGQVLETHLGWACSVGWRENGKRKEAPVYVASPVFEGAREEEIKQILEKAGLPANGKTTLYDGKTGEPFDRPITVGYIYMMKLIHLVDEKIHARSIGPYSLITQQPLGGKAQFGGQRFGEMEVWALEAYGAANVLQEMLTVKSDDVMGRVKAYQSVVKGENIPEAALPESFKVLVKEMQSLGLSVELVSEEGETMEVKEEAEEEEAAMREARRLGLEFRAQYEEEEALVSEEQTEDEVL